jgi:hypothetical protein
LRLDGKLSTFTLFLSEDNVGEFLIDMSRLFQSETVDGINELADVLSLASKDSLYFETGWETGGKLVN